MFLVKMSFPFHKNVNSLALTLVLKQRLGEKWEKPLFLVVYIIIIIMFVESKRKYHLL